MVCSLQVAGCCEASARRTSCCIKLANRSNKWKSIASCNFRGSARRRRSTGMLLLIIFIILKGFCRVFRAYRSGACSFIHGAVLWIFQQFVHTEPSHFSWCRHVEQLRSINCVHIPRQSRTLELLSIPRLPDALCLVSRLSTRELSNFSGEIDLVRALKGRASSH